MHNEGGADAHESVDFTQGPYGPPQGPSRGGSRARPRAHGRSGRRHRRLRQRRAPTRARARPPRAPSSRAASSRSARAPGNVNYDPALFAGAVSDILLQQQIYEKLVTLGQDFSVQPTLATEWDSPDGKVWTFKLQTGVKFSNGEDFTADDVVYTMDRLRSKKLGSPMADVYANVKSVVADRPHAR